MAPTAAEASLLATPVSAIANRSGAKVKGAIAPGERSNRRLFRDYAE